MLKLFLAGNYTSMESDLKMWRTCSNVPYIQTLWETLFPIIKTSTPTVKYGGHCLRYERTLVGKNYLLLFLHIMEDTAPDNAVRTRGVRVPRDRY